MIVKLELEQERMNKMPITITDATLQEHTKDGLTLVDFWAPWCGPCRMLGPVLEELEEELAPHLTVAKLNIDENQLLAQRFGIQSIPTMVLFQDGVPVEKLVGFYPKEILQEYLEEKIAGTQEEG